METVKIKADTAFGYALINKEDYESDPDQYELYDQPADKPKVVKTR